MIGAEVTIAQAARRVVGGLTPAVRCPTVIAMLTEERRRMSNRMDDLPLILGFTLAAFALGAATPVIVHRLEPEPAPPAVQTDNMQQLRQAVEALERTVGDLSKTVSGLATDVVKLRAEVAAARLPSRPEPPPVPAASPPPNSGAAPDLPSDAQPKPPEP